MAVSVAESAAETRRWLYKQCVPGCPWGPATRHINETIHDLLASERNAVFIPTKTGSKRKYILTQAPWHFTDEEVLHFHEEALHFQHYQKTKSNFPDLIFKELKAATFEVWWSPDLKLAEADQPPESVVQLKEQGGTRSVMFTFDTIHENTWGQLTDQISTMFGLFEVKIRIDGEACNKRCKVKSLMKLRPQAVVI
jgi:hypothetical protein